MASNRPDTMEKKMIFVNADDMKQALSETQIGRRFEAPAERDEGTGTNEEARGSRSSRPDRLAG